MTGAGAGNRELKAGRAALSYSTTEDLADAVRARHGLSSLHLFARDEGWRVFGARGDERFQQSVEEGGGKSIAAALLNLNARLDAGPIKANSLAPLPRTQTIEGNSP
jgi:hypothetical protein